jgi:outer membrane protein assembly factor BamB
LQEPEEEHELALLEERANRFIRIIFRIILPGLAVLVSLVIAFKVTSKAGKAMWEFRPAEDNPFSDLTSYKENIYAGCDDGMLYALDVQRGTVRWTFKAAGSLVMAKPVILGDNLCITWDGENIYAVDTEEGSLIWKRAFAGEVAGAPITGENAVYYISNFYREIPVEELKNQNIKPFSGLISFTGSNNVVKIKTASCIYALDCTDGHDIWTKELNKYSSPRYFASPRDTLYLSLYGQEGDKWGYTLLAIDAESGKGKWKAEPSSGSLSGIYPGEKGVLIVSTENFYFISHEGEEIWNRNIEKSSFWKPTVAGGKLYFKEEKNKLTCMELTTGREIWTAEAASTTSSPVIGEQLVFFTGFIEKPLKKSEKKQTRMPQPKAPGLDTDDLLKQFGVREEPSAKMVPMLYALDTRTGKTVWTKENIGGEILYHEGKLFVIKSSAWFALLNQEIDVSNRITAIHAHKGKTLWQYTHRGAVNSTAIGENRFCFSSSSAAMHIGGTFSRKLRKPTDNAIYALSIGR